MAQTLTSLLIHIIFSTKNRLRLITPEIEPDLFAYIGGILKTMNRVFSMPAVLATTCTY
jgi:putative transposase